MIPRTSWRKRAPKTRMARRGLLKRCGAKCFLLPQHKPAPGFPICAKRSKSCKPTCQGLRAAFSRTRQTGHVAVAAKARKLACKLHCPWTERAARCT